MPLSPEQKRDFVRDGFLVIPGVVPREKVDGALAVINHWLGNDFDRSLVDTYSKQSYCPELRETPEIKGLIDDTTAYSLAEDLTAPGHLKPTWRGQIALRFPRPGETEGRQGGHIDGVPGINNDVPEGELHSFTLLAGVALSDVTRDWAGNFTVWPGSHRKLQEWFATHSLDDLIRDRLPKLDYGAPHQIQWRAGDLVLAHHLTVHGIAKNLSPHIRYAVFFRLHHLRHEEWKEAVLADIWREFDGLADVVA